MLHAPCSMLSPQHLQQLHATIAVTPFVVVPAYEFEEPLVQFNTRAGVINRRGLGVDEVGAHHFVSGVVEYSFEVSLAGLLQLQPRLDTTWRVVRAVDGESTEVGPCPVVAVDHAGAALLRAVRAAHHSRHAGDHG